MLLPLLGICALFGRFWGKSWEPVQGLLTDGCGCGDPRCCGNLFILCLFLLWQIRQRFRNPKNPATKKKGLEVSLLRWAVPPWCRLAIPVPSPRLSICPCTQKRLEIHVQKLVHRQKWGPPQKLRESWAQFLLSQLPGHTGLEESGQPGACSPLFPSTCRCLEEYHKELHLLGGWQFAWGFCNIQAHLLCKVPLSQVLEGPGWMEQAQERKSLPAPLPVSGGIPLLSPPPAPKRTPGRSLLSIEGPCLPADRHGGAPKAQEPEKADQELVRIEGSLTGQTLQMEEELAVGKDALEATSQISCTGGESHPYQDASFPWGSALEDADSEASEQELEVARRASDTTPLTQPLLQMGKGLRPPGKEEDLQDIRKGLPERGPRTGSGTGQHQQRGQTGGIGPELGPQDPPLPGWQPESQTPTPPPVFVVASEDSDCAPTVSDTDSREVTSTHEVPPKRPTLKKSSRLLLESLMRRKIAHLKWGLPRRIQESEWLFQLMGPSSPSNTGMQSSSSGEDETSKEEGRAPAGEHNLGELATQSSSCAAGGNQAPSLPKAARGTPDPVLQPFIQFKERLKCQEKEAQKLPLPPRKRKGKNDPDGVDLRAFPISLDEVKGPKQSPSLWGLQDLCDEALSRAMLPVLMDCARKPSPQGAATRKQTGPGSKDPPISMAWEWRVSQEAAEEASSRSRESSSEPRPGPSNEAPRDFEKPGNLGPKAGIKAWSPSRMKKALNPKVFQDNQALPWAMVCHWSMPSASQSQNTSDSSGDTPQSHSSEAHLLPAEHRKRTFRSQGGRAAELGASSYSSGRAKGPFRSVALRLGTAFMNKMPWALRRASSATSVSNHSQCQEDPDPLRGAESAALSQTGLSEKSWSRDEGEGSDHRGLARGYTYLDLERDSQAPDQSSCDDGTGESSAQASQSDRVPPKSSWAKRLRYLLTRLSLHK
ncbi:uncharacterized protein LOC100924326 [Sarcophilus harrisii]|uniref:Uncharacterized protein n=1 Tax=Sarcophilus harrisii TaxID=9305 RepID=A0A7N4NIU9_SARHA|nr:uncharacterized protein LOC100924326 [Sarcophilus harrisii]